MYRRERPYYLITGGLLQELVSCYKLYMLNHKHVLRLKVAPNNQVHIWLLVRFSVFPLIYSSAGNTCGKLVKGRGKLVKGRGRLIMGHTDRPLHLGKTF